MIEPELAYLDKKMTEAEEIFTEEMVRFYSKVLFSNTFHGGLSALVQDEAAGRRMTDPGLCKCEKREAVDPHECPYHSEVNEDHTLCTCCEECERECCESI